MRAQLRVVWTGPYKKGGSRYGGMGRKGVGGSERVGGVVGLRMGGRNSLHPETANAWSVSREAGGIGRALH